MRRLVVAGLFCVAAFGGSASAGPTRMVHIETDPPNATVYVEDIESGPKCKTPCDIPLPIGNPTIIIRLEKYEPLFENIEVTKGKRPLPAKFKLRSAIGTIIVSQPKGASVSIDGEDQGIVGSTPLRAEVTADSHMITVTLKGKTYFDDGVTVATGEDLEIGPDTPGWKSSGSAVASGGGDDGDGDGDDGDGGDGDAGGDTVPGDTGVTDSTTPGTREPYLSAALATDVGFRRFSYDMPVGNNLKPESEDGQVLLGLAVEVFPMRLLGVNALRGLSVFARGQFGVNGQTLTGGMIMGNVTTFWASYEGSLRYRKIFGGSFGIEGGLGYVRDQMQFNASDGDDLKLVPDAIYSSFKIGAKALYISGPMEVYLAGENRIVAGGGDITTRFDTAKASGFRVALGGTYNMGKVFARVEGALMHYAWTFTYDGVNDVEQADGATDSVRFISVLAGYRY